MFTAADLAALSETERVAWITSLSPDEAEALATHWRFWARPEQVVPDGNWIVWLILAGRGFGKTRTGAETVREWNKSFQYVNLIGATADDVREIMVEGESGILAICSNDERPRYAAHKRRLEWPNGAKSLLFSAEEPDRLRGKQHEKLWCDELAAWRYADAWDQASFGLRLGDHPQAVVTTTPRPTKFVKDLIADPTTHITRGSTYDNAANLAAAFIHKVVKKYEGTRLGRQELQAQLLDDTPGALWTREMIERAIIKPSPENASVKAIFRALPIGVQLQRIVVALDPNVVDGESSDEFGMVVAGLGSDGRGYVLQDASKMYLIAGAEWATEAIKLYKRWRADCIVAEVNNGGDMIAATIRMLDPNVPVLAVHATRGKVVRAEPISMLYEKGLVSHVGSFPLLEDQMSEFTTDFDPKKAGYSPDRVDALVWALTELKVDPSGSSGIIDFYRQTNEENAAAAAKIKIEIEIGKVAMLAPAGVSTVYGISGVKYIVGADRLAHVAAEDVGPLRAAGFQDT